MWKVTSPLFERKTFSKVELECVMLNPPHTSGFPPLGLNPSFCFNPGQPSLRLFLNYGAQQVIRNTIGRFQDKAVALEILIYEAGILALHAHVDQLSTFTPQDASFAAIPKSGEGLALDRSRIKQCGRSSPHQSCASLSRAGASSTSLWYRRPSSHDRPGWTHFLARSLAISRLHPHRLRHESCSAVDLRSLPCRRGTG